VNGGRNYNGPKVEIAALEKSDYVLRSPSIQCYCGVARKRIRQAAGEGESRAVLRTAVTTHLVRTISRKDRSQKCERNPQRPYVGHPRVFRMKRWSHLHGDMQE
jgi:hypothetical protein